MTWGFEDYQYCVVEGWGKGPEGRPLGIVSSIATDSQDRVYVIDRYNQRIQVFDLAGELLDLDGKVLGRWGEKDEAPGQFIEALHGAWMDSREDFYICEVPFTPNRLQKFERIR